MTSPTLIDIPIRDLVKHPKNPRRRAVADPELVDSIRTTGILQPPVVFQSPDGKYPILMGHRRVDGAKKAGLKTVTCLLRTDLVTEGQQVEAMLIENGRREDLTPIEEAEGFAQLQLFGYKQKDIAKATGRDPKTVSARLKLLKLAKSTKDRVHKGQMTLDDALAIAQFADDPEETKRLEEAAKGGDAWSLKHSLDLAKRRRKNAEAQATTIADLKARGIPEITIGPDQDIDDVLPGGSSVYATVLRDPAGHHGCLRWAAGDPSHFSEGIDYYCATPTAHYGQLSEAERKRREDQEAAREAREKAQAEAATARAVRAATVMATLGLAGNMTPPLRDLVRGLLPVTVADLTGTSRAVYQDVMNLPTEDRWEDVYAYQAHTTQARMQITRMHQHLDYLGNTADNILARALIAALLAHAEQNLNGHGRNDTLALEYLDLLAELGHEPCPVDDQLRADITGDTQERAS